MIRGGDSANCLEMIPNASENTMNDSRRTSNEMPIIEIDGMVWRTTEVQECQLESERWNSIIINSGHSFDSALKFRDDVYMMSVGGRF